MGPTSISTPVVEERPAKQCPPLRTASPSPDRRASAIASATSPAEVQAAATYGRTSHGSGPGPSALKRALQHRGPLVLRRQAVGVVDEVDVAVVGRLQGRAGVDAHEPPWARRGARAGRRGTSTASRGPRTSPPGTGGDGAGRGRPARSARRWPASGQTPPPRSARRHGARARPARAGGSAR